VESSRNYYSFQHTNSKLFLYETPSIISKHTAEDWGRNSKRWKETDWKECRKSLVKLSVYGDWRTSSGRERLLWSSETESKGMREWGRGFVYEEGRWEYLGNRKRIDLRKDEMIKENERTAGMKEKSRGEHSFISIFLIFFYCQLYSQCYHPYR